MSDTTYYQRNRDVILNKAKDYYENDKKRLKGKQEINTEIYLKQKKIKRENMEETDIIICLKKERKIKRISKKLPRDQKIKVKNFDCMKHGTRSCVFRRKWRH